MTNYQDELWDLLGFDQMGYEDFDQIGGAAPYSITSESKSKSKKFKCEQMVYKLQSNIQSDRSFSQSLEDIREMFSKIHVDFLARMNAKDQMRLTIDHDDLDFVISTPFTSKEDCKSINLINLIESVLQSFKTINLSSPLSVQIVIARLPSGGAPKRTINFYLEEKSKNVSTFQKFCNKKRSIINIENNDFSCLLRAILVGKSK